MNQQKKQIVDLILQENFRVSSAIESKDGLGADIEHCFEISDGSARIGVVIILTNLVKNGEGL